MTDRDIRDAAEAGVTTVKGLCQEFGIAISCPSCASCVRQCLAQVLEREISRPASPAAA